eukprot:TRINITY_DN11271_c0_g1_i1.p1 TRINITY_DN11271_c0_g1~~TRINITY_DN11271_c0_g1_i1.p1  ORF type:complete len:277 (+),score=32.23 TRINITY_DN11271_c0_g1_i1:53-832(+)
MVEESDHVKLVDLPPLRLMRVFSLILHIGFTPFPGAARQGVGAPTRAKIALNVNGGVTKLTPHDFLGKSFIGGGNHEASWLIFLCHERDSRACRDCMVVRQKFHELNKPWVDVPFESPRRVHFAEVDCFVHQDLCSELASATMAKQHQAAVLVYRHGSPSAVWQPKNSPRSVERQLEDWVGSEFGHYVLFKSSIRSLVSRILDCVLEVVPPAFSKPKVMAYGVALVTVEIAVVAWVVVTGFEMRPKLTLKRDTDTRTLS